MIAIDNETRFVWLLVSVAIIAFFISILVYAGLMPENCLFYETRNLGLMCDGFDPNAPARPCPICQDEATATVARLILSLGACSLVVPFLVIFWRRRRSEQGEK